MQRNDIDFKSWNFPCSWRFCRDYSSIQRKEHCIRVEFFGDEIDRIREVDALTGEIIGDRHHVAIFPASHYVTGEEKMKIAIQNIEKELEERVAELKAENQSP